MTVAAQAPRRQHGSARAAGSCPQPTALLAWYDRHRRRLPWRAVPGERSDPYRVWLSEIMLQQTTVKAVAPYYARFLARWPDIRALAAAPLDEVLKAWAGLGYYSRARNLHTCARAVVERHGGAFPADEDALRALPGIGSYTAAAIAAIAFDAFAVPVDGNVERVVARLYAVETPLPAAKRHIAQLAQDFRPKARAGDFAQALMDLGATICTPKKPACSLCPWTESCAAHARGDAEAFPRRTPKREGALRRGAAFVVRRSDGHILVRTRPPRGLLGGMTEVPTTEWTTDFDDSKALEAAPRFSHHNRARPHEIESKRARKTRRAPSPLVGEGRGGGSRGHAKASTGVSRLSTPTPNPSPQRGGERAGISWRRVPGMVRHVFTHFPLELVIYAAEIPKNASAPNGMRWVALGALHGEALPSLMRKVVAHALPSD